MMKAEWILPLGLALAVPVAFAQQNDAPAGPPPPPAAASGAPPAPMQHRMERLRPEMEGGPAHMRRMHSMEHGPMEMHHGFGFGDWWKNPELARRVELTPDQIKKLDGISLDAQVQIIHLRAALEEDELMMRSAMEGPAFDQHKAELQIDKVADARAALEKAEARLGVSLRSVLTTDQWTKLHTPPEHHMGHMSNWKRPEPQAPGQGPA